ncbi:glycosyltransferase family 39 protein [Candidatus Daviesbacteria bacterium]|nr:glycosyltransferase family 39 protein [Candidatus Daviesbacteria bacterium]
MMNFILKNKFYLLGLISLGILYFLIRLPNLTLQPIFADEAIYIRWAQVMRAESTLRFLPLSDGKTPLFMWVMIPLFKIFSDPLLAGRMLSVFSGFLTFFGGVYLAWRHFNRSVALLVGFILVIAPMIVFFDRMALVDSLLSAFSMWALILSLELIKYQRIDLAMFLGYIMGGSLLTKPPGFFNLINLPTSLLIFDFSSRDRPKRLAKILGLWIIVFVITMVIYNVLRLGPGFSNLNSRNQDYVFSPTILLYRPLDPFIPHFHDLLDWLPKILTLPILFLSLGGIFWSIYKKNRLALVILFWSLIPLIIQMALLRTFTARYILFSFPPLLILAGWFLSELLSFRNKWFLSLSAVVILMIQPLVFDYYLLIDPSQANLPREERRGYLEDWTAGYGLKQIASFLDLESKKSPIVVGTEGSFGTLPDGLQIYLDKNRQVSIVPGKATVSAELRSAANSHPTFFVANKSRYPSIEEGLTKIMEFPKAVGNSIPPDAMLLFKVSPTIESSPTPKIHK